MGADTVWRDDIEIPSGQPADLETITNIINNLYALKEELPLIEGNMTSTSSNQFSTNANSLIQIEVGHAWHGNVPLGKSGHSGKYQVKFKRPFAHFPVVITQPITWGTVSAGTTNLHWLNGTAFEVSYWGQTSGIRRGVFYIAIGIRGS